MVFWSHDEYVFEDWHGFAYKTTRHKDGGAIRWHKELVECIKIMSNQGHWNRGLDWCAGDGGLGLALLGEKIIDECVFMDHYLPSIEGCNANLELNQIKAEVIHAAQISDLNCGKFDIVFANPPHHRICELKKMYEIGWLKVKKQVMNYKDCLTEIDSKKPHRHFDLHWKTHFEFYQNITQHLEKGADLFMLENSNSTNPLHWEWGQLPHGLEIIEWIDETYMPTLMGCYVLHLRYNP